MTPPTLPGDIPGLLRRGSPVLVHDCLDTPFHGFVVWMGLDEDDNERLRVAGIGPPLLPDLDDRVALDLSDPTGRAHAAWWLAGALPGARRGQTRAHWSAYSRLTRIYRPSLHTGDGMHAHQAGDWLRAVGMYDGWTASTPDARYTEALRRVVLHVAGRTD